MSKNKSSKNSLCYEIISGIAADGRIDCLLTAMTAQILYDEENEFVDITDIQAEMSVMIGCLMPRMEVAAAVGILNGAGALKTRARQPSYSLNAAGRKAMIRIISESEMGDAMDDAPKS